MPITWHLLTGEYPPGCGGVGDYTAELARALTSEGDAVHVWTPARAPVSIPGVAAHTLPDCFGEASRRVLDQAFREIPGVILLQYVPNALGWRGANLSFCRWFSRLHDRHPDVRVMFHEPYMYLSWSRPWSPANGLALVQRAMARLLLRGATELYQSTENWQRFLAAVGPVASIRTLPIPSSIPIARTASRNVTGWLAGHFGSYGAHVAGQLESILPAVLTRLPEVRIALFGEGSLQFRDAFALRHPVIAPRVFASGPLDPPALAAALHGCDVLIQPYPDGITTRRTSVMAGLRNGVPTVATDGALTEPVWRETGAVALAPVDEPEAFAAAVETLLRDPARRAEQGRRGADVYAASFSIDRTVAILRAPVPSGRQRGGG